MFWDLRDGIINAHLEFCSQFNEIAISATPNPHQTLRARAATAAQLAASTVGPTAGAARQPRSSPRKAGVQPGLHVWAYDVPPARHPAR